VTDHQPELLRAGETKQWVCPCGWAGTVVMYGNTEAHAQAAADATRHAIGKERQ
jgi:hypothetical protein